MSHILHNPPTEGLSNAPVNSLHKVLQSTPWVVHVEDDEDFSAVLRMRLESVGVVVVRAFDGLDGLDCVAKYPPNAVILDVEMPNGRGDEILRKLKAKSETRDIPVIMLSCNREPHTIRQVTNLGAAAYLTKPLDFGQLHAELARHIDILPLPSTPSERD